MESSFGSSKIIGGGKIRYAKEGANTIAQSGIDDFVKQYRLIAGDGELGVLFQKTLTQIIITKILIIKFFMKV